MERELGGECKEADIGLVGEECQNKYGVRD